MRELLSKSGELPLEIKTDRRCKNCSSQNVQKSSSATAFGLYQRVDEVFHRRPVTLSGTSPRKRWRKMHAVLLPGPHEDVRLKRARGGKENALLRQERDLLKKPRREQ